MVQDMPTVFLAGGITGCPDWQSELIGLIGFTDATIYNPRRKIFPSKESPEWEMDSRNQIKWEFDRLKSSDIISFWFSRGSDNPIVLYELGMWGNSRNTSIIVGVDPEYPRRRDVIIQTNIARPGIRICEHLKDVATIIRLNVMTRRM